MMRHCREKVPAVFDQAQVPFTRQYFIPRRGKKTLFYDTTAGLWHALGGKPFTEKQNACFEHLHCGSYSDAVGKCPELKDLPAVHEQILKQPSLAKGIQKQQNEFYRSRAVQEKGELC
jgi:hypothetical protein